MNVIKKFKNPKAIELIEEAQMLEDFVTSKEKELERNNLPWPDLYFDMLTQAANLRIKAEYIEAGVEDA